MAENTPLYMDINNVYSGDELGLPYRDLVSEGIVGAGDLAVTAGTGNTVNVASGAGWVLGDTDINRQPTYRVYNDATVNKGITPDPTNPRYVRVVAQINDATFAGATRNWQIVAIHGTPAGAPAVPALPASAMDLATILVPAAAASSAAYTITDTRPKAHLGGQVGTYTAFTGSFGSSLGGAAIGNGTCSGRYIQIGKFVHFQGRLAFGSTTNVGSGYFLLSYPLAAAAATVSPLFGTAYLYDTSAGFLTQAIVANENNAQFRLLFDSAFHGGATNASGGIPYTWAAGDEINWNMTYEAA